MFHVKRNVGIALYAIREQMNYWKAWMENHKEHKGHKGRLKVEEDG